MRRILAIAVVLCLLLSFFGCGSKPPEKSKPKESPLGEDGIGRILLDAGHGFRDVGCTSEYLEGRYEYELTMDFISTLASKLVAMGYEVVLTHNGQSYPSEEDIISRADALGISYMKDKISPGNNIFDAYERAIYASVLDHESEIDLMLSIHVNANESTNTAEGFEIDYCAENSSSDMSIFAFDAICYELEKDFNDRRLKKFADSFEMSFIVTKYTSMPSILFETGYATTPNDASLILDAEWRNKLMTTLSVGIDRYFKLEPQTHTST